MAKKWRDFHWKNDDVSEIWRSDFFVFEGSGEAVAWLYSLSLSLSLPYDNSHTYHPTSQYDDTVDDHDEKVYRNDDSERTGCDLYHPESV